MGKERRASPRLDLAVPMTVQRIDSENRAESSVVSTMTKNISAGGVYFSTLNGEDFKPGMRVELKISMPHRSVPGHDRVSFSLVGKGKVVRIDPDVPRADEGAPVEAGLSGIAIQFDESLSFKNFQLI